MGRARPLEPGPEPRAALGLVPGRVRAWSQAWGWQPAIGSIRAKRVQSAPKGFNPHQQGGPSSKQIGICVFCQLECVLKSESVESQRTTLVGILGYSGAD